MWEHDFSTVSVWALFYARVSCGVLLLFFVCAVIFFSSELRADHYEHVISLEILNLSSI